MNKSNQSKNGPDKSQKNINFVQIRPSLNQAFDFHKKISETKPKPTVNNTKKNK
jgi:hypothetical protein